MRWPSVLVAVAMVAGCAAPGGPGRIAGDDGDQPTRTEAALADVWEHLLAVRETEGWAAELAPYLVEAAAADGRDPSAWPPGEPLLAKVDWPPAETPYMAALRPLHAFALAKHDPAAVEQRILAGWDGRQFGEPSLLNDDAYALLTLRAAVDASDDRWPEWTASLAGNQSADGGWSWSVGGASESDMTGMVLAALQPTASPVDSVAAAAFVAKTRAPDGGHSLMPGGEVGNCDSTVWALRAFASLDPVTLETEGVGGEDLAAAWDFLFALRRSDGGYVYQGGGESNLLCTVEVATLLGDAAHGRVPGAPGTD